MAPILIAGPVIMIVLFALGVWVDRKNIHRLLAYSVAFNLSLLVWVGLLTSTNLQSPSTKESIRAIVALDATQEQVKELLRINYRGSDGPPPDLASDCPQTPTDAYDRFGGFNTWQPYQWANNKEFKKEFVTGWAGVVEYDIPATPVSVPQGMFTYDPTDPSLPLLEGPVVTSPSAVIRIICYLQK